MGTLEDRLTDDMRAAMKAGEKDRVSTLRMAIAAIKNEKVAGKQARELSEAEEIKVVTSEVSKRKDSAEAYTLGHRPELAAKELAEAEILASYLPARLSDAEVDSLVSEAIAAAEAASGARPTMKQMGQVVRAVNEKVAGRADGAVVAAKVRAALG